MSPVIHVVLAKKDIAAVYLLFFHLGKLASHTVLFLKIYYREKITVEF